ncbi:MAG TPA: SurA N-terminal domain-containing protein [Polyangia bacterium]|jgi:PPIC-type PPIASE domain.|nr:SurA N-terminal domain-containing protein [Polyangia bacterium]
MLEQMRQQSRSLLIYLLFSIVIVVFIVNFGPQSIGGCGMRMPTRVTESAARVDKRVVSLKDWTYAYTVLNVASIPPQQAKQMRLKETIMDMLIDRELLVAEAERLGFRVGEEEVEDLIGKSRMLSMGREQKVAYFENEGVFSYDHYRKFVQYHLGMSPKSFIEQQRREIMAARMRDLLRSGVSVSADEVKETYLRQSDRVNLEYLRFAIHRYENEVELRPDEIAAYTKANQDKLKKLYDERKAALYEKQPKQRKLRFLLVAVPSDAEPDKIAETGKRADALAVRARKGESLAKLAKASSDDENSRARGGELGWQRKGGTTLGTEVEDKVWAAKDGELVGPVKIAGGLALVVPEVTREGDIPFEQARLEIAESELRQERSLERAKAAASAALTKAKAEPSKSLKDLFPAPDSEEKTGKKDTPSAEETGLYARRGSMVQGIGPAPTLAKVAFELSSEAPLGGPFQELGSFIVVKLKEHLKPDMAEFEKEKQRMADEATQQKGQAVVMDWARQRCQEAKEAKKIEVNLDLLRYEGGPESPVAYEPCSPPRF